MLQLLLPSSFCVTLSEQIPVLALAINFLKKINLGAVSFDQILQNAYNLDQDAFSLSNNSAGKMKVVFVS